jgi:cell wall-associated NlpC family hydrolase
MNKNQAEKLEEHFSKWLPKAQENKDVLWTLDKIKKDWNLVCGSNKYGSAPDSLRWTTEVLSRVGIGSHSEVAEAAVADAVLVVQEAFDEYPAGTVTHFIGETVVEKLLTLSDSEELDVVELHSLNSEIVYSSSSSPSSIPRGLISGFSLALAVGGVAAFCAVAPVQSAMAYGYVAESSAVYGQSLVVSSSVAGGVGRDGYSVTSVPAVSVSADVGSSFKPAFVDMSGIAGSSALLASSLKYVGLSGWDCTKLVEQSLRDLGYSVGDLGPMGFGGYGTVFYDASLIQPGDIMMRSGHVAIYAGGGMAVQGGYSGLNVVFNGASPSSYSSFVRVG